ncbi:SDR family oxidoreductase [Paenibacillus sp. J5C_2022]|uniref:SDR family NAD(P)-dependent oxidoreductase n=1 Tax=Paenibacillus sp. J5C2022 TaxID=2977129 RepID=UPI0021CDF2D5|nr:SDR family NAD(P)-dependent oxidoreductase [Paenibacillus sp. J5C2022]MCU6711204.1 SDR family oxidoreductase [Paenibacillus sp. J5C2022]
MRRFEDRTVIVTGGATGIGLATAKLFATEGANVLIAGRSESNGYQAVEQLKTIGGRPLYAKTDVSDEEDVKRMIEAAIEHTGRIDVLINNAAMFYESDFLEETTERWRAVFDTIVNGAYWGTKYAAKAMIEAGIHGAIVNVSSINGYRALNQSSHYNAAKGALDQLTRGTALELAPHGIRVNGVAPGFIDTGLSVVGGVNELETDWFKGYYVGMRKIPQARAGEVDEVASVIAFLASEAASYVQGATIPVDGGLSVTF